MMRLVAPIAAAAILYSGAIAAQPIPETRISDADFARSDRFLLGRADLDLLNGDIAFRWIDTGESFYYRSQRKSGTQYVRVESATGKRAPLFDHRIMAASLSKLLNTEISERALPIDTLTRETAQRYVVVVRGRNVICDLAVPVCNETAPAAREQTAMPSPGQRYVLFARDHDLWLEDKRNSTQRRVTFDGVRAWSYGRLPESSLIGVTSRRLGRELPVGALWAPDERRFVSYRLDERHVPELALLQSVPEDGSFRPRVYSYRFDMVGDRPSEAQFFIYDVEKSTRVAIDYRPLPSTWRTPLSWGHLWWSKDGSKLYLIDSPLDQPFAKLLEVNPQTGAVRLLLEERADTTFFPSAFFIGPPTVRVLDNGDIVWFSERSGWGHLYRYDGRTGKLRNAVTQGEWLVRGIERVDERAGFVYFCASGREPGEDIYNRHLYRVKLDGSDLQLLTPGAGDHDFPSVIDPAIVALTGFGAAAMPRISPNGAYILDHYSTPAVPGRWLLRRRDGTIIAHLEDEDASRLPTYTAPEPFVVKSADGRFDLHGVLFKPADFDPTRRYAVIDHVYPGPQVLQAPQTFGDAIFGAAQAMADLGFVTIRFDGRGGPFRSKEFRDLSYRNMDKAGMLEDHIAALRQLAATRPWLDLDRVGIFGTSGGGFASARALIDHPDFFKVGVAGAGNHEQRINIRTWGETFHGPPGSTDYDKVFAGNNVAGFKGKLLLAHGDMDDNVHPAHTLRLADALIKANKQFDMLILPNVSHRMGSNPYFQRITQRYFLKHLLQAQLPSESDIVIPARSP